MFLTFGIPETLQLNYLNLIHFRLLYLINLHLYFKHFNLNLFRDLNFANFRSFIIHQFINFLINYPH